jgi:hypothetical protein
MTKNKLLTSLLERRKTFDSPLANHFSPVIQSFSAGMGQNGRIRRKLPGQNEGCPQKTKGTFKKVPL